MFFYKSCFSIFILSIYPSIYLSIFNLSIYISTCLSIYLSFNLSIQVFDRDGDGLISEEELRLTMNNLGEPLTEAEVNRHPPPHFLFFFYGVGVFSCKLYLCPKLYKLLFSVVGLNYVCIIRKVYDFNVFCHIQEISRSLFFAFYSVGGVDAYFGLGEKGPAVKVPLKARFLQDHCPRAWDVNKFLVKNYD